MTLNIYTCLAFMQSSSIAVTSAIVVAAALLARLGFLLVENLLLLILTPIFFHFLLSLRMASHCMRWCMVAIGLAMAVSMAMGGYCAVVRGVVIIGLAMVAITLMSFGHGVVWWVVTLGLTIVLSLLGFSHVVVWVVGMGLAMPVSLAISHTIASCMVMSLVMISFHSPASHISHPVPMRAVLAFLLAGFVCGLVALHWGHGN